MKTVINFRFLFMLFLCLAVLGGAIHALHAVQVGRHADFFLQKAHLAKEEKRFDDAIRRFQRYLQLVPGDTDALAELGLLLADRHQAHPASVTLEKVLRSQPNRDDVRRRLVQLALDRGRYSDAKEHLNSFLLVTSPEDGSLWSQLGTCQAASTEYAAAEISFRKAIQYAPQQLDAYRLLAEVLRRYLDRPKEADECMQELIDKNPNSARAHVLQGQYLEVVAQEEWALGHAEQALQLEKTAIEDAEQALQLEPNDIAALLLAARLASKEVQYDQARGYAERVIAVDPKQAVGYTSLARVELRTGHRKEAIDCLKRGRAATSGQTQILWDLARLLIEAGDLDQAEEIIHERRAAGSSDPLTEYLEAQLQFARGHWQKAAQGFEQVAPRLASSPDWLKEIHVRTASCYERLGNTELQLAAYRKAARVDPLWPPARLGIAATLSSHGQTNEALEEYRQISKLEGMSAAGGIEVARLLIVKNLRLRPAERDWSEVDKLLDQIAQANPDSVSVAILRAEALVGQDRVPEAEKLLLAARSKSPDKPDLWSALAALAARQEHWDRAAQLLDEAKQKFGDRVWLRLAEGRYLVKRYGKESAPKLKELSGGVEAFSPAELLRLYRELAAMSVEAGDQQQAKTLYRLAADTDPKDLDTRLLLFELAFQGEDASAMEQLLKEIQAIEGDGPLWYYGQAARLGRLAGKGDKDLYGQALQHLAKAGKLRPGWARVPLMAARLYDQQGRVDPALENYLKAIELGEHGPAAVRRTTELLYRRQRYTEADQMLRRLQQEQGLFSSETGRMASEVSARLENPDRALQIARQVALDSKDWRDHLWLGQLLGFLGRQAQVAQRGEQSKAYFAEAEKSLRHAVTLGPEAPETWVSLVRLLAVTDQKPQAEAVVLAAKGKLPAAQAPLALGPCYEALGNLAEAAQQYQSALAQSPKDPLVVRQVVEFSLRAGKPEEAEALLRQIVAGEAAAKAEDVAWARRVLASILRTRGGYQNLQQGLAMVQQNLSAGPSPEDQQAKALLLASHPSHAQRQQAIRILENLLQSQPSAGPEVRFVLAQLYLAEKDWPQASKQMRSLLSGHGNEPRYVAAYAAMLLQRREIQEADLWLGRLEQLAPDEFPTAGLKAEALVQRRKIDEAIEVLRGYLVRPAAKPPDRSARLRLVAGFLERVCRGLNGGPTTTPLSRRGRGAGGEGTLRTKDEVIVGQPLNGGAEQTSSGGRDLLLAEAEKLYRDYVNGQPDQELLLASFLARQGRLDEALAVAQRAWPLADPVMIAREGSALLEAGGPAQLGPLEQLLLAAAEKHHRPPLVLTVLADLRVRQGQFREAEELYREAIKADKTFAIPMNNLALLLALQQKQLGESLELVEKAMELAGPLPSLLDTRASVLLALGQPQKALADLEEVLREEPRPNRHYHQALAYWRLGQAKAAAKALEEANKLGLKPEQLHPLERPVYRELAKKLD